MTKLVVLTSGTKFLRELNFADRRFLAVFAGTIFAMVKKCFFLLGIYLLRCLGRHLYFRLFYSRTLT